MKMKSFKQAKAESEEDEDMVMDAAPMRRAAACSNTTSLKESKHRSAASSDVYDILIKSANIDGQWLKKDVFLCLIERVDQKLKQALLALLKQFDNINV